MVYEMFKENTTHLQISLMGLFVNSLPGSMEKDIKKLKEYHYK